MTALLVYLLAGTLFLAYLAYNYGDAVPGELFVRLRAFKLDAVLSVVLFVTVFWLPTLIMVLARETFRGRG